MLLIRLLLLLLLPCLTWATTMHTLPNGLTLIIKEDHRMPVAVSMIWYRVGSADEHGGVTGISHALEHMMFKGTSKHGLGEFSKSIAANGGQENAWTNTDYTMYFQKIAADKLPTVFELEADRMQNLLLDPKEFDKEINVVAEERRMRNDDNPQTLTYERFLAAAHLSNPYHHMPIGWMNDIQNMTAKDLRAWYEQYYAPNNAVVVIVGDVEPDEVISLANKYFGPIPKKNLPLIKPQREPPSLGLRDVIVKQPAKLPLLILGYNVPSRLTADKPEDAYTLSVITGILDGGHSARLPKDIVREQQLAVSASAYYDLYKRFDTLFTLHGVPTPKTSIKQLRQALKKQIQQLKTQSVTKAELERVKTQIIAEKTYRLDSPFGQGYALGLFEIVGIGWQEWDNYLKSIKTITPEDIQRVAKKYFTDNRLTVVQLIPTARAKGDKKNV